MSLLPSHLRPSLYIHSRLPSLTSLSRIFHFLPKMPFCNVGQCQKSSSSSSSSASSGIDIFYKTYGHGKTKVLLIIGLAGTHESWGPQVKRLTGNEVPNDDESSAVDEKINGPDSDEGDGIEVCCFDNRGMGRSSIPVKKSEYITKIMAKDALALMDLLGWRKAHVFGHSMGAMIACKLAAMAPERILSLALLNVTGGGFQCFPKINLQMIAIVIRFLRAKTPEQRATVDLDTHYTKEYLDEYVGPDTRRRILYQEYVTAISSTGMQSNYGFEGQINACWTHKMTSKELEAIGSAGFLVSVIHGRYDIIAQIYHARKLAEKLQPAARMVDLHGGHLVSHENPEEVNQALMELIKATEMKLNPQEWSNLPRKSNGWAPLSSRRNNEGQDLNAFFVGVLSKIQMGFLYFFGLFVMAFEHARKIFRKMKPIRVGSSLS